jgi:UDP-N-acetylglucosamine--N-acetylmuramyl-(pentapeptide) pyrophosphoryl-undecaprenol N-acetylglucosamine transferase
MKDRIDATASSSRRDLPTILITGGNQGSHIINKAVEDCLPDLCKVAYVIHQTGDSKLKDFERLESKQNDNYKVEKFIINMGKVMGSADLVVSRAGINTLVELAYLGKPTLVIPVPYLYKDEQNKNAKFFEKLGLVKILPQSKLSGKTLLDNIKEMTSNLDQLKLEAKAAKAVVIPDASKRLALETLLLAKI